MMSHPTTVRLSRPITSVRVVEDGSGFIGGEPVDFQANTPDIPSPALEAQQAMFSQVCEALNKAVNRLNEFCDKAVIEHKEGIARLSVEIAKKILVRKVEDGDYEIKSIIKEALGNAPTRHDVIVHLNHEDYARCQQSLQQDDQNGVFVDIQFVSDPKIGRAECMLETPKGIVKSLIDENLERVHQALKKA